MEQPVLLTKSRYCRGLQCPKMLWMDLHMPKAADPAGNAAFAESGRRVGEVARSYFGDYVQVSYREERSEMVLQTKQLMSSPIDTIAEAAFLTGGLYCAVDLLHRCESGWELVEVKSATRVSPAYVDDLAFQYYVLTACGVPITRACLLYINNRYVRQEHLDLQQLFNMQDCTADVIAMQSLVAQRVREITACCNSEMEPQREIGLYCDTPHPCVYRNYCGRNLPRWNVFGISRMALEKKHELYRAGIVSFADVLEHLPDLNAKQRLQVETTLYEKNDTVDVESIRGFLDTLSWPVYHLDFETFQQAVPQMRGCSPYQQIPFQYSLHIENHDGTLQHREYLAPHGSDPRRELAEHLCNDIPADVCVLAYNTSFEKGVIRNLAAQFPDLAEHLLKIHDNLQDLMTPFSKGWYYSDAMQGSYSIKYVLPALYPNDPALDYHNLDGVHNGAEAAAMYAKLEYLSPQEVDAVRRQLLQYCGLDTYAMVRVLARLREAVEESEEVCYNQNDKNQHKE